jgi:hypothetical protein
MNRFEHTLVRAVSTSLQREINGHSIDPPCDGGCSTVLSPTMRLMIGAADLICLKRFFYFCGLSDIASLLCLRVFVPSSVVPSIDE